MSDVDKRNVAVTRADAMVIAYALGMMSQYDGPLRAGQAQVRDQCAVLFGKFHKLFQELSSADEVVLGNGFVTQPDPEEHEKP